VRFFLLYLAFPFEGQLGLQESCNFGERVELEVVGLGLDLLKFDVLGFFCGRGLQVWWQFEF
jgi:hypothetical protein